jgi:hypothetical protein
MNKKIKSLIIIALGLILGASGTVLADPFSIPVAKDLYNGNTPNDIPTPAYTPGLGLDLFNAANLLNPAYAFTKNENLDPKIVASDHSWTAEKGSVLSFYVIGRSALNVNKLGYYARDVNNTIFKSAPLLPSVTGFGFYGDGLSPATGFIGVDFTPFNSPFGWYIESTDWRNGEVISYYSEPQLNPDLHDHLVTYALPELEGLSFYIKGMSAPHLFSKNAYLVGFDDRLLGNYGNQHLTLGDDDYNDILILVDSTIIQPTPNPPLVPEPATITLVASGLAGLLLYRRRIRRQ